jgi:hypothetical protein
MGIRDLYPLTLAKLTLDLGNQGSVKLDHLTTSAAREMVVRLLLHSLIMAMALTKTVLLHQPHLLEEREGTIHRRQAETVCVLLCKLMDSFGVQMLIAFSQDVQDQAALRCETPTSLSKHIAKLIPSLILRLAHLAPVLTRYCE